MQTYTVDNKQRKAARKKLQKKIVKESNGFVKASYYISKLLIVLAIMVGCFFSYRTSIREHYTFEYIMPLVLFGGIYGISFMMSGVYKGWAGGTMAKTYSLPLSLSGETISYDGNNFTYSLEDDMLHDGADTSRFSFSRFDISKVEYDEETRLLTIYGEINEGRYKGDMLIHSFDWAKITLIDTFKGFDLHAELCDIQRVEKEVDPVLGKA